jgi:hypothetical protein
VYALIHCVKVATSISVCAFARPAAFADSIRSALARPPAFACSPFHRVDW